jgi:hypothetical protein
MPPTGVTTWYNKIMNHTFIIVTCMFFMMNGCLTALITLSQSWLHITSLLRLTAAAAVMYNVPVTVETADRFSIRPLVDPSLCLEAKNYDMGTQVCELALFAAFMHIVRLTTYTDVP